ncbi:sigma-70 family RNA polymerase sigma factor [Paracoccaceae bacterium GXU_MW_L88]
MTSRAEIEEMVARVAIKDKAAFSGLYDATSAKLFGVCLSVLGNRSEAEDALQETYLRIWNKADSYAVTGHSPMTWLITIARNISIDRLRRRKAPTQDIEDAVEISDSTPGPEAFAIAQSERARIESCMDELPPDRANAVRRVYLKGQTYRELAAHYEVPLNTMRTWLRRSLRTLKDCLSA